MHSSQLPPPPLLLLIHISYAGSLAVLLLLLLTPLLPERKPAAAVAATQEGGCSAPSLARLWQALYRRLLCCQWGAAGPPTAIGISMACLCPCMIGA